MTTLLNNLQHQRQDLLKKLELYQGHVQEYEFLYDRLRDVEAMIRIEQHRRSHT